ncbi:hypothetical protein D9M71_507760 [compost metagenome]
MCQRAWQAGSRQRLTDADEAQGAGVCVQQGHTEQQERGAGSRQHHVLDTGFQRTLVEEGIGHQTVDRHRQQFQTDEQPGQVLRADQHQATGGGHQDQQVQFFTVARVTRAAIAEVGVGEGDTSEGGDQDQCHVQASEAIDLQQWGHGQWRDLQGWQDRQQRQVQTRHRQQEGLGVVAAPGDRQHHHDDRGAGNQQRR